MLHILLGRAGCGKTETIIRRLCQRGTQRPQILIVPEQYSHEMERTLCRLGGNQTSAFAEVLSFSRLANRVFAQAGGLAVPTLDAGGRLLLMHRSVQAVAGQLAVYRRPSKRAAFLQNLLATAGELKSCCVRPDQLTQVGQDTGGEEGERLRDLGLILGTYDALVARRAADPRDRITRLADRLAQCGCLRGKDVWLDCFTDFTPQEQLVIRQALAQAESVTVAVTCGDLEGPVEGDLFSPARRTIAALTSLSRQCSVPAELEPLEPDQTGRTPALRHLEAHLFGEPAPVFAGPAPEVELMEASTPYAEVEWAAGRILELVRTQNLHFRDIAVSARTMDGYASLLESVFERYGIPLFLSQMSDILQKPVLALLTAALDAISGGYEYEDMFRYLKTGLAGVDPEDCDLLENYVLRWDLRGRSWTAGEAWSLHPEGYSLPWSEEDQLLVAHLDELRRGVTAPLEQLRKTKARTGRELSMAVYDFLEAIRLPARLSQRTEDLRAAGDLERAEEYRQLWDILTDALEQCAGLLDEEEMELTAFSELFQLVLSQYSVGAIPVALDRVSAGEAPRMAHKHVKYLFVLGANDTAFPLVTQPPGLLNDGDRSLLSGCGLELAASADQRLDREQTILYELLALPEHGLMLSWPTAGEEGAERRPSFAVERIRRLLPECVQSGTLRLDGSLALNAPRPALDFAGRTGNKLVLDCLRRETELGSAVDRVEGASRLSRGHLSRPAVEALYGNRVRLSASRMDKVKSCHFSYFMQYGLKAKARRRAGFDAPEAGTFVHYVLEHVLTGARLRGGVKSCEQETVRKLTRDAVDEYIFNELGGMENKTPRFRYLFRRLLKSVDLVVDNVVEELRRSDFQPIAFELGFGEGKDLPPVELTVDGLTLSVSGFVDRVDGWVKDGKLYIRVVDYKTGTKSFDLTDIWHGLSMQMLLYLFTLEDEGETCLGGDPVSAGVLYLPAHDVIVRGGRDLEEGARRDAVDKALTRSGLLLSDRDVLDAMEHWEAGEGPRFLPLRVSKKSGEISGDALATAEQLGKLRRHIGKVLRDIGGELAEGNIAADPYYRNAQMTACAYCEYAAACHFEEGKDCRRYLYSMKGVKFWESLDSGQITV